jgi:aminoglycoside phosphotransferase family enzyme
MKMLKNQEITSLAETICRMTACTSRNRVKKFGEKEVCWASFWQSNNEMVKKGFSPIFINFFTISY